MYWLSLPLRAALLILLLLVTVTPASAAQQPADISLRLWSSTRDVRPGDIITLELIVNNNGQGRASYARVDLEYVREEIEAFRTRLNKDDMWVSELGDRRLTVEFNHVLPGEERRALIFFRVNEALPPGFRIITRATAHWQDVDGKQRARTNPVVMTVAGEQPAQPRIAIAPNVAPAAALFRVTVADYFPNETLVLWLNMPDGTVKPIDIRADTDGAGMAAFDLRLRDLPPGEYGLVILGHVSRITLVTPVTITP